MSQPGRVTGSSGRPPTRSAAEPRLLGPPVQRWRLTFRRAHDPDRVPHRAVADEWTQRLIASDLPVLEHSGRGRGPLAFAAPLPAGMACHEEFVDLLLRTPLPLWRVRELLVPTLPTLVTLIRLDDVWIGRPALPAVLRAADYRVPLPMNAPVEALQAAVKHLLAAPTLERPRARGQSTLRVDVRPLIDTVLVDVGGMALRMRTRFLPDRGAGRPEDVLGAVDDSLAEPLPWGETERERLILAE